MGALKNLLIEVMDLARMPVSDKDFVQNFNRAVNDIENRIDVAKRVVKRAVVCDDIRDEYPLSEGCMGIQRVSTGEGYYITDFTVQENSILFGRRGVYLLYEKLPHERIHTLDDTPTINSAYHYSIAKYIASKIVKETNPGLAQDLMDDYAREVDQMSTNLRKNANSSRRIKAPIFR